MSADSTVVRRQEPDGSVPDRNPADPAGAPRADDDGTDLAGAVVVGGGAAGLAAAAALRAAGRPVTLLTDGPPGGDCTWHGCVPSKSLLEAAAAGLDARAAVAHARAVVARVARTENEHALAGAGVRVLRARAVLRAGPRLRLPDGTALRPEDGVVLATGSRPVPVPGVPLGDGPDGRLVRDTDGWLDGLAAHLVRPAGGGAAGGVVVVGGGASGVELAQALGRLLGDRVTLVERAPELLPDVPGAGPVLAAALRRDGVHVLTGVSDDRLPGVVAGAGLVLLAAGRAPVLDVLGPGAGVRTAGGAVVVDTAMATSAPGVVAAGDLVGGRASTHLAVASGRVAAATLLGGCGGDDGRGGPRAAVLDAAWAPRVVWTDPQVAAVGRVPGGPGTRSVRLPLSRNDRAHAAAVPGRPDRARGGFAQAWVEGEEGGGRLVGAVMVSPAAGEAVAEVALAGRLGLSVEQWSGGAAGLGGLSAQHPYPSWSWTWSLVADRLLAR